MVRDIEKSGNGNVNIVVSYRAKMFAKPVRDVVQFHLYIITRDEIDVVC